MAKTAADIMKKADKAFGEGVVQKGLVYKDVERLPTGIFPFDLATGGGFPMGCISVVWGPESSGKTNLILRAIAVFQMLYPALEVVFVDAEHAYDPVWARIMGVDNDRLIVVQPNCAEQAVDCVDEFGQAEDVGLLALDSIAALVPENEINKGADTASVGGNSALVGKMFRKIVANSHASAKNYHYPTYLMVNQNRFKVGQMFGNPECMPGGNAPRFYSKLTVHTYGKNIVEKSINPNIPAYKETNIVINKWKVPILATNIEYRMAMIPGGNLQVGHVDDFNTIRSYAEDFGLLKKNGNKWVLSGSTFEGSEYSKLDDIKEALYTSLDYSAAVRKEIIDLAMADHALAPQA